MLRGIVAERTNPVVAWIGSGLSGEAGLPSWSSLEETLVETLAETATDMDPSARAERLRKVATIRAQDNHWVAFKMLQDSLGKTTYREAVRQAFSMAGTVDIPDVYRALWEMNVRGILSLNLDRLAARAYSLVHAGSNLSEFSGKKVSRLRNLLNGHQRFVGNLHGVFEDNESWIFTQTELADLLSDAPYKTFIETCLSTYTVLFLGIGADDLAVGGHLERLASLGIETTGHFWLTDRRDEETDSWAQSVGIQPIRYDASDGHSPVSEFFADLASYVPEERTDFKPFPPKIALEKSLPEEELPKQEQILQWDAERIRGVLNERAMELLKGQRATDFDAYERFSAEYDQAIYRAWYTSTTPDNNLLLGYQLKREVARGAFGRVFEAMSPNGTRVAVKVLHEEVRRTPEMLMSFRRGVSSMEILYSRKVDGMVTYMAASEIPAFVVMEWVDGPTLTESTTNGYIGEWPSLLPVAVQLARIIRRAHELPERVLHRDLRPSNVMLRGYYTDPDNPEVVVLDFDLSWHKGALEHSIVHSAATGYLAPEQTRHIKGVSTRSAAVDSFGLGMTLYYMCGGVDPLLDQHRHADWQPAVQSACNRVLNSAWKSIPERFARMILAATRDNQAARWDMAEISGELELLSVAAVEPEKVNSVELLTEELAARSEVFTGYEWDSDGVRAIKVLPTGMQMTLEARVDEQGIQLGIEWTRMGNEDRMKVRKYLVPAAKASRDQLRAAGWVHAEETIELSVIKIDAAIDVVAARGKLDHFARSIDTATRKLRFDGG